MRWLVYAHPIAMLATLALSLWLLRLGLELRRARLRGEAADSTRHRKLAHWVVPLVLLGWGAGLASMGWLRAKPVFESVHFPLASAAMLGIAAAGVIGLLLERGHAMRARSAHALLGGAGVLLALAAAVAGMAILP